MSKIIIRFGSWVTDTFKTLLGPGGTVITLVVGTALGLFITDTTNKPDLVLTNFSEYYTKDGFYVSAVVENHGRIAGTNVRGFVSFDLTDRELKKTILSENNISPNENLPCVVDKCDTPRKSYIRRDQVREIDRELLVWSKVGNPSEYNINPGGKALIDVCKVIYLPNNKWYIIIPSEQGWKNLRVRLTQQIYTGKITVSPSNDFATTAFFRIGYNNHKPIFKIESQIHQESWMVRLINSFDTFFSTELVKHDD